MRRWPFEARSLGKPAVIGSGSLTDSRSPLVQTPIVHNTHTHSAHAAKVCGHVRHVGTCADCQRAQLTRWGAQLAQAQPVRYSTAG
jgi:hypothetical protein